MLEVLSSLMSRSNRQSGGRIQPGDIVKKLALQHGKDPLVSLAFKPCL